MSSLEHPIHWRDGVLTVDRVPVPAIADAVGTPTYVYSASAIRAAYGRLAAAFAPIGARFHYAIKASPNLHLCRLLRSLGAGMDVVSGGEMERAWLAGTPMSEIVFAGVGKSDAEIRAALDGRFSPMRAAAARFGAAPSGAAASGPLDPVGRGPVGVLNVESESELRSIARLARELGVRATLCVRVNPNVDPHTHEYTTTGKEENKFGIDADRVVDLFAAYAGDESIDLAGLHVHIGSPVPRVEPYAEAVAVLLTLIDELERRGHPIRLIDLGGGWPVPYRDGEVPPIEAYAERLVPLLEPRTRRGLQVCLEPGRFLLANSAILVTRVEHLKRGRAKTFVICDAGMHVLIRPALYRAFHFAWPVAWRGPAPRWSEDPGVPGAELVDVVGPICETGDFLARSRMLPPVEQGDLLAVFSAGAYGMSMASNYNDHGRPAEVLVDGDRLVSINERQTLEQLMETERVAREISLAAPVVAE